MLGRRQLRAKAMQSLYSYYRSNDNPRTVEKNMLKGIDQIQNLYYYLLNILPTIKEAAEEKIEIGLQKNFPTAEEANPSYRFVQNPIFSILEQNNTLKEINDKHHELTWSLLDVYPSKIFKAFIATEAYQNYMKAEEVSFKDHKEIILYLFDELIADNEELQDFFEEKHLHWTDDLHIANTMAYNTLKSFTPRANADTKLFALLKDQEHLDFTIELFRKTIAHEKEFIEIIDQKASNWELERIALVDRILLQMGLAELLYFPNIPPKVTINEYVEISKSYSTPNSKIFINGILDRTLKELKDKNQLRKAGRGLL